MRRACEMLERFEVPYEKRIVSAHRTPGDLAEFEIMPYHAPIVSLLKAGEVVIDWTVRIPIVRGMVKYYHNECMVLVEEERRVPVGPAAKPS